MVAVYASVGAELTHYQLDVEAGTLTRKASIRLPSDIQYVWPHANKQFLYAATSDQLPRSAAGNRPPGTEHHLVALKIATDGSLSKHGDSVRLPLRPVHLCTDAPSKHVLVAFPIPAELHVYAINANGSLGGEVAQGPLDSGIFCHQVRVTADNRLAIMVTRGNDPTAGKPEDPGALKVFKYQDGRLGDCASVAPNGGFGFGPRHIDFHPNGRWLYASLERENKMMVFGREGDAFTADPVFTRELLAEPANIRSKQMACTVHVHPKGHVVYGSNRAFSAVEMNGRKVMPGGENNIVVYRIDEKSGDITAIQHEDTRGIYCRTFHIDPSGRLLIAANAQAMDVLEGGEVRTVPASLSLFRIAEDGRLSYLRKYDIEVGEKTLFWTGMA